MPIRAAVEFFLQLNLSDVMQLKVFVVPLKNPESVEVDMNAIGPFATAFAGPPTRAGK